MKRYLKPTVVLSLVLALLSISFMVSAQSSTQNINDVWVVPIDSEISPATAQFVKSRIKQANETDPQPLALVFLIDTPGGRVDSMKDISDAILQDAAVPTVSVVQNAYSAGALIAMSSESVAMLPGSSIGAALTVVLDPTSATGTSYAGEKANSVTRSQFRSVADARGRNSLVAEGMVSPSIEIPGLVTTEELVTLSAAQAVQYDIADLEAPSIRDALSELGYGNVQVKEMSPTSTERAAMFVTSPIVAAALLAIGVIGILLEVFIPGFGIPGIIGTLSLLLFFGGTFIARPSGIWDIALIMVALILLVLELFVIPGFGIAGIAGLAMMGYATYRIFEGDAISAFSYTAIFGTSLLLLVMWLFSSGKIGNRFVLADSVDGRPSAANKFLGQGGATTSEEVLGERGVATSDLRPAGVARFGNKRIDVVTEGDFITTGAPIEIVQIEGSRVVVREVEEA